MIRGVSRFGTLFRIPQVERLALLITRRDGMSTKSKAALLLLCAAYATNLAAKAKPAARIYVLTCTKADSSTVVNNGTGIDKDTGVEIVHACGTSQVIG